MRSSETAAPGLRGGPGAWRRSRSHLDERASGSDSEPATIAGMPMPIAAIALVAGAKLAVHLLTNGQYGYQRDELYYLASGNHPAAGYVDYPSITPLLARLDAILLGNSPWALRLVPSLVGACLVLLVALLTRELGGGRKAQILGALAAGTSLMLLGSNWLFQTVTFDQLWWIAAILVFARLLRSSDARLWLAIGALLGLGLETKLTILNLGVGFATALILPPLRSHLRTRWPWLGLLTATVLLAPNLIWQQLNGWPTLDFLRTHSDVIRSAGQGSLSLNFDSGGVVAFLAFQPVLIGLATLPLWVMGWYYLLRQPRYRPLGTAALTAFLLFLLIGKAYYPGPLIPVLLAAGCVQLEASSARRRWRHAAQIAAAAMVVQAILALPITIPLVPQSALARFGLDEFRKDYADTVGWPELVGQVAGVYRQLTPAEQQATVILASNYGEAGAVDLYGQAVGLPPAVSPNLTFWYWKPAHLEARTVIAIGFDEPYMRNLFTDVTLVDTVRSVDDTGNEEVGRAILLCRQSIVPLDDVWPSLRRLT
jgi:4-amino-4-deoxy-L-arabinose transferase-like glycosyltransferase